MSLPLCERAPAKANLILHVGPRRADGLHELCSLFASLELADRVEVSAAVRRDEVHCPGVTGDNLAAAALRAFRAAAPAADLPPLHVAIDKRIPVAAGLGGGSADAAAVLRVANRISGEPLDDEALARVAAGLGADVPSQLAPRHALVAGAGERVEAVTLPPMALVLVPATPGLSTADVYAEADRVGATRARLSLEPLRAAAALPLDGLAARVENDLAVAARSLRPALGATLEALRAAGALAAEVTGSGPTAFGVFSAADAAATAAERIPGALVSDLAMR